MNNVKYIHIFSISTDTVCCTLIIIFINQRFLKGSLIVFYCDVVFEQCLQFVTCGLQRVAVLNIVAIA
jgi:hypothetical protein